MKRLKPLALLTTLGLIFACGRDNLGSSAKDAGNDTTSCEALSQNGSASSRPELDLLFVIDNSASIGEEQAALRKQFPTLIDVLRQVPGGLPDLHVGVISSDLGANNSASTNPSCDASGGDRGIFQAKPECHLNEGALFARSYNDGTQNNFSRTLTDVFACLAKLGMQGCGYQHQLQSMRLALSPTVTPSNAGFLRPSAHLAVVMLTDEDDCSAPPKTDLFLNDTSASSFRCNVAGHQCNGMPIPESAFDLPLTSCAPREGGGLIDVKVFSDFVKGLKPDPSSVTVSLITGLPMNAEQARYRVKQHRTADDTEFVTVEPVCTSIVGVASPALRLKAFADALGENATVDSICTGDLVPALTRIGSFIASRIANASHCQP